MEAFNKKILPEATKLLDCGNLVTSTKQCTGKRQMLIEVACLFSCDGLVSLCEGETV